MHETSLVKDLLRRVFEVASCEHAKKIVAVRVKLGVLSGFSAGHLREHFIEEAAGTAAEGARLDVELGDDPNDPDAQQVVLLDLEVSE